MQISVYSPRNGAVQPAGTSTRKGMHMQYPGLCTAVAILLKERNRVMCGVQSYVSSVLFSNNIHKKVCASVCVCVWHGKEICK